MSEDINMLFEHTMMKFFGKKAYQTASLHNSPKHRREWLIKFAECAIKRVDKLDANSKHKERIVAALNGFISKTRKDREVSWDAHYCLIRICGLLLGYRDGCLIYDPVFMQSRKQYYTEIDLDKGDSSQRWHDKNNCIKLRFKVVKSLQSKGLNTQLIAIVLNTTEYEIKKLKRDFKH